MAQHCGGGGRKVFGVIVGRDDGRPATRKEIRQALKKAQQEQEALERELAVLRSKCPGVPEFTRDELESIRHDAVERILDLLAGTMEARP